MLEIVYAENSEQKIIYAEKRVINFYEKTVNSFT